MSTRRASYVSGALLKENLADALKKAIFEGRLNPGQRVVEATWSAEFRVAQASVREAINLLIGEGFLVKDAGRSARVVSYQERDVEQIYQVRGAIEGLAAQLACVNASELSALDQACDGMSRAAEKGDMKSLLQHDFDFHAALLMAAGNRLLVEIGFKLIAPLFAFMKIQVINTGQGPEAWMDDLEPHRLIVQVMRMGNPGLAAQFVQQCMGRFAYAAYGVWNNKEGSVSEHKQGGRRIGLIPEPPDSGVCAVRKKS